MGNELQVDRTDVRCNHLARNDEGQADRTSPAKSYHPVSAIYGKLVIVDGDQGPDAIERGAIFWSYGANGDPSADIGGAQGKPKVGPSRLV